MPLLPHRRNFLQWSARFGLSAGAGVLSAGCGSGAIVGFDRTHMTLDIANAAEPLSLDPHKASGSWENNIIGNMFVGLTTEDAEGRPIPGMAERWETSTDGLTWTFFLRRATWSDGEACNAHDFVFAFRRILDPDNQSQTAQILYPILNAFEVYNDQLPPDAVGVSALGDLVLEIRLAHPTPYLPQILKHYTAYPVPKHLLSQHGDHWIDPDHIVVNGAFTLRKWWSNYIIHLEKNPAFFDAENVAFNHLYFYPVTDVNAAARKVEAHEAGWSNRFPANQYEQLQRDLPGYPRVAPYLSTSYFSFNMRKAPFDDRRVRVALSMCVDRDFLSQKIYRTGETPAYSFVPLGIAGYPRTARYRWADLPLEERRVRARALLEEAGFGENIPLRFELSHRNTSDNPRVAEIVQDDWRKIAPWVVPSLRKIDTQVHYDNLRAHNFEIGDGNWIADYEDPSSHLALMETRTVAQNYPGYSNPAYDRLMRLADFEPNAERRLALMAEAEQIMLDDAPVCAIVFMNSTNLVHPDLAGWEPNIQDIHRARWFNVRY